MALALQNRNLIQRLSQWRPFVESVSCIHTTSVAYAEPLRRKQKLDPAVLQLRVQRKQKKLEKEIKELQKSSHKPKPVDEMFLDFQIRKEIEKYRRPAVTVNAEEIERRSTLFKKWCNLKRCEYKTEMRFINRMVADQTRALNELRMISEELYQAAVQASNDILPHSFRGPTETPPIVNYMAPDGEYSDTTKKYD